MTMKAMKTITTRTVRPRPNALWLELLMTFLGGRAVWNTTDTPSK